VFLFQDSLGKPVPQTILDFNKDDKVAVAPAGPYANHLHLLQTDNHTSTSSLSFLHAACSS